MQPPTRDEFISLALGFAVITGVTWFAVYGLLAVDTMLAGDISRTLGGSLALTETLRLRVGSLVVQKAASLAIGTSLVGLLLAGACAAAAVKTLRAPLSSPYGHRAIWLGLGLSSAMHFSQWRGIWRVLSAWLA